MEHVLRAKMSVKPEKKRHSVCSLQFGHEGLLGISSVTPFFRIICSITLTLLMKLSGLYS